MSAQMNQVTTQIGTDPDMQETKEWLDALEAVLENEGPERAHYLMERLVDLARRRGAHIPFSSNTAYVNTIPPEQEQRSPGNIEIEERLRSWMRWNDMAMVVRANRHDGDLGGHLVELELQHRGVEEDRRVGGDRAGVGRAATVLDVDVAAVDVLLEGRHPHLLGQPEHPVLGGSDEGAAGLD